MISPTTAQQTETLLIHVHGAVQGVGFRPFVYRLARQCQLVGSVRNSSAGVIIEAQGSKKDLDEFQRRLVDEAPAQTNIEALTVQPISMSGRTSFAIDASDSLAQPRARLPRDLASCLTCQREIFSQENRRRGYPFTNCTSCGPRYSIIEAMPYDRPATTMRHFTMCSACRGEYDSADDRRFHAQPNACQTCGPQIGLWDSAGKAIAGPDQAIRAAAEFVRKGLIVALKGLGGFQLLVRADDTNAVIRLRQRKHRPSKPFAVMVPALAVAEKLAVLGARERRLLQSSQNPIVLAGKGSGFKLTHMELADEVAPNVGTLGVFLPTTPLHALLLSEMRWPVVVTSGNRSEEPIVTDEQEALRRLAGIADVFLVHDRPIVRGVDDSVVRVIAGMDVVFRLGRGYAPLPLPALEDRGASMPPALATGGHQKSAVALWTGAQALLGQHLGDLDDCATRTAFTDATRDLRNLYQCDPKIFACDLHPDYFTTQWALDQQTIAVQIQHHHAHAVSCMVEHGLLDREVLAIVWDGTGFGTDGVIWGGEVMRTSAVGFQRVASLLPFPLPGGDTAIRHPNRSAFGLLWVASEGAMRGETLMRNHRLLERLALAPRAAGVLATMIRRGVNTPWTSSVGRLFDAVAALILEIKESSYEGEPAVWLEAAVNPDINECYPLPLLPVAAGRGIVGDTSIPRGDWRPMLSAILDDLACDLDVGIMSARFHNCLVQWAEAVVADQSLPDVVLSGGCFQNRILAERILAALGKIGRRVYLHSIVPPGDGGLAAGQLAVAICQRQQQSRICNR